MGAKMDKLSVIIVVGDGLGDRPVPSLSGRTPLEVAKKPNIDKLARISAIGLWDPISPGVRPGSDTAHLTLFGINPIGNYPGRGPFEAIGAGAELRPGDIAFRGNFATVDDDLIIIDRRAGRHVPENRDLTSYLNENIKEIDNVEVHFYSATEHRLAVVLRGEGLSSQVSDTDPHEVGVKVQPAKALSNDLAARRTAEIVNKLTRKVHELLRRHPLNAERVRKGLPPVNFILLRGAGKMIKYEKIQEREGIDIEKAVAISATAMIKGVCKLLGFEVITPEGATGGVDTDVLSKADSVIEYWRKGYDLIYMHVKGTDAASHDGKPDLKIKVIEKIDAAVGRIIDSIDLSRTVIAFTGDHTTPIVVRDHTGDPVPLLIYSPTILSDGIREFNERTARRGGLGRIRGIDLLYTLLDQANRVEKFGA
jgi:2,3-bisphosphoglycerate-independent phosphoglycerate mutase